MYRLAIDASDQPITSMTAGRGHPEHEQHRGSGVPSIVEPSVPDACGAEQRLPRLVIHRHLLSAWRWEVAAWIHEKGSDQWDTSGLSREEFERRITRSIKAGETWLALDDDDRPVGTIAIDIVGDAGLWTDDELRQSYAIHRMMVPRGQGTVKRIN